MVLKYVRSHKEKEEEEEGVGKKKKKMKGQKPYQRSCYLLSDLLKKMSANS